MIITGATSVAAFWWLFGPTARAWAPVAVAVTAVGALGLLALINLVVGRFAPAALPGLDEWPSVADDADPDATVEMETRHVRRRPLTTGTTCVSATDPTVMLRLPGEVPR